MPVKNKLALDAIVERIDATTEPMALEDAKEFLEQLSTEIESRIDGIKDDLRSRERRP